jgi:2-polyprenyl-3-methyl-5-hydroxy-6-metoxy-1,4-benzoquinol methylase
MRPETIQSILDINRQFYQIFADAFAATRRRIQPGIRKLLAELPREGNWLDLGCGSGALALEWVRQGRRGSYTGIDFSAALLAEAQRGIDQVEIPQGLSIHFQQADLLDADWSLQCSQKKYDGILCFAAMHHLPGRVNRLRFLQQVRQLLQPASPFFHSNWQFQHSPKLVARIQPWRTVMIDETDVESGDTLLDWRYSLPGQAEKSGLRYVHIFSLEELANLAAESGFAVTETFESDGEGGRLGIYQRWEAI